MFFRLSIAATAALVVVAASPAAALAASHAVVHRLSAACPPYHKTHARRLRRVIRYRHVEAVVEQPLRYARDEQVSVRETYRYTRIDDDSAYDWRTAAEAHLSATDQYGYLTWPGKFPRRYAPPVYSQPCAMTCGVARAQVQGDDAWDGGQGYGPDRYSGEGDPR
jgi:hypothetical protein